jgi:hypothetical protein
MNARIPGIHPGSPLGRVVEDYFEAVRTGDYLTARACLIGIVHDGPADPRILEAVIRQTHEMEPPA